MLYGTMSYVVNRFGKILMIRKNMRENDPNSKFYTLPGGKLEPGEKGLKNPEGRLESGIRETEDETGITILKPIIRGTILFNNSERIFDNWPNPEDYYVSILFAKKFEGKFKSSEEGNPVWIPKNNVIYLPKNPGDALMYEWLRKGKKFVGVIKHKGNEIDKEGTWVDWI